MIDYNELMKQREINLKHNFIENFKFQQYEYNGNTKGLYAFDLEATTDKDNCIVYSTMLMDVNSDDDICLHNGNKKDLVDNLENLPYLETTLVAHNGGRYDWRCILDEFIRRGYVIEYCEVEPIENSYVKEKRFSLKNEEEKRIKLLFKNNTFYSIEINIKSIPVKFYTKNSKNHKKGEVKEYKAKKLFLKDSCLMLTGELKRVCYDFLGLKLSKDGLDYNVFRDENYKLTDEEKIYCYEDVFSLKHLLKQEFLPNYLVEDENGNIIFNEPKMDYLTSAGFSFSILKSFIFYDCILTDNYKKNYSNKKAIKLVDEYKKLAKKYDKNSLFKFLFPQLTLKDDNVCRASYFGGLSATGENLHKVNNEGKYKYKHNEVGCVLDENSMYPDKMKNSMLPFGLPEKPDRKEFLNIVKEKPEDKTFITHVRVMGECKLKKGKFPTIRIGGENNPSFSKKDIFISNEKENSFIQFTSVMNSIDYYDFIDSYDYLHTILSNYLVFNTNKGFFETFINYFYKIKCTSAGAIKQNAKLILNSVYGKFGTKKINDRYEFELNGGKFLPIKQEKQSISDSIYVPMASLITSYARHDLKTVAETVGVKYVDYFDTDSLHFRINKEYVLNKFKKIDDTKLGYWAIEGEFKGAIYLGSKRYAECLLQKDGSYQWEVKCCGIPKDNQEYFANNIELFDYCECNKKDLDKGNIKATGNGLYLFNDIFVRFYLKGICQTIKTKVGNNGIVFTTRPYMITR